MQAVKEAGYRVVAFQPCLPGEMMFNLDLKSIWRASERKGRVLGDYDWTLMWKAPSYMWNTEIGTTSQGSIPEPRLIVVPL